MRKAFLSLVSVIAVLAVLDGLSQAGETELGPAIFCLGINENWEPIEPGTEFTSNVISCLFIGKAAFGVTDVMLSVYQDASRGQKLLYRYSMFINPQWDNLIIEEFPLPELGNYTFVLSNLSGEPFSSGQVTITEKTVDEPIPEAVTFSGNALEDAFNKFRPRNSEE
jgi:hypothetical protein